MKYIVVEEFVCKELCKVILIASALNAWSKSSFFTQSHSSSEVKEWKKLFDLFLILVWIYELQKMGAYLKKSKTPHN